jgi:hypothetical protein
MNASSRWLLTVLALATLALLGGGAWFYRAQEQHLRQSVEQGLQAAANLMVRQIAEWRADQLAEGNEVTTRNESDRIHWRRQMKNSLHNSSRHAAGMIALAFRVLPGTLPAATADEPAGPNSNPPTISEPEEFDGLDIEQLSRVQIVSATRTPAQGRLAPARTTVLDQATDQATIAQSGARNLNELLEIYAPNSGNSRVGTRSRLAGKSAFRSLSGRSMSC